MSFRHYVAKIIFSKKQLGTYLVMLLSLFLIILFFMFFKTYTRYYIEELKLIYPSLYLVKDKELSCYKVEGSEIYGEIFEQNIDDFLLSFDGRESFVLNGVALRSFPQSHLPLIIKDIYQNNDTIYLSNALYNLIKNNPSFHGVIYLPLQKNNELYRSFKVQPFTMHDNSKWLVMQNKTAKKIFSDQLFNKVSYYTKGDEEELKKKLQLRFHNIIYTWEDYITLSNEAFKESMVYLFLALSVAIVVLGLSSIIFFTKGLVDDLLHLTRYAFFYAHSLVHLYGVYLLFALLLLSVNFLVSYSLAHIAAQALTSELLGVEVYNPLGTLLPLALGFIVFVGGVIFVVLYRFKQTALQGLSRE